MEDILWPLVWITLILCITYYNVEELRVKESKKPKKKPK